MKKEPISIERDFDSFIICYVSIAMIFLTDASQDNLKILLPLPVHLLML